MTVGNLQVLDVRQRQVDRVELGLVLGFHRRDLGFLQRVLHRHVRSSFLDRSNTVLILRVYQSAVLYPCRRHPRRSQAHETLGAMTTVIMRTSEGDMRVMFLLWDATSGNKSLKIVEIPIKTAPRALNNPDFPEK